MLSCETEDADDTESQGNSGDVVVEPVMEVVCESQGNKVEFWVAEGALVVRSQGNSVSVELAESIDAESDAEGALNSEYLDV